eukprot:s5775_g1.t1
MQRRAGDVTVHSSSLLHGVTRMASGERYTLILFFQSILHACTAKWRQQQAIRNNRRDRARACSETNSKHHVMPDWQKCVVPTNGTFFQYARRGIEGKTHLFHDPFASFGDYHTWRPEHGVAEWDRLRSGPAYSHKIDYTT